MLFFGKIGDISKIKGVLLVKDIFWNYVCGRAYVPNIKFVA